jgi:membrane protease YdiL (CAAX protease family)
MKFLQSCLSKFPLVTTTIMVMLAITIAKAPAYIFSELLDKANLELLSTLARLLTALIFIVLMSKLSWAKNAGISQPIKNWRKHWFIVICPILVIGLINFTGVQWDALQFSFSKLFKLLSENLAVGLFEETVMRGFAFYVLARAWSSQTYGLYKAALAQSLIFGLLHLLNLSEGFQVDVIAQVIYATLLGIGFAGVVAYSRTLWTVVFGHTFINTVGSINSIFNPDYVDAANSVSNYLVLTVVIFVLVTLPGLWCLKKAKQSHFNGAPA